jgi:hypothetical protein
MTHSEPSTSLASAVVNRCGTHDGQPSCLACGDRIGSGDRRSRSAARSSTCAAQRIGGGWRGDDEPSDGFEPSTPH